MSEKDNWKYIQAKVGVASDGVPGAKTATAIRNYLEGSDETVPVNSGVVNQAGIELIQHFESCLKPIGNGRYESYADAGYGWSLPTIGWGSTYHRDGSKIRKGEIMTQEEVDSLFVFELEQKASEVTKILKGIPTTEDQFAALTSFAYNAGAGNLSSSTLLKRHRDENTQAAANEFLKWVYSNGTKLAGLERRRKSELNLYLSVHPSIVR